MQTADLIFVSISGLTVDVYDIMIAYCHLRTVRWHNNMMYLPSQLTIGDKPWPRFTFQHVIVATFSHLAAAANQRYDTPRITCKVDQQHHYYCTVET